MNKVVGIVVFSIIIFLGLYWLISPASDYSGDDEGFTTSEDYQENAIFYASIEDSGFVATDFSAASPPKTTTAIKTATIAPGTDYQEIFHGVFMQNRNGIVVIRARLNDPDVRFFVGHPPVTTVVCSQMDQFGLQIAVNGSGFYAESGIVDPFGMVDGKIYSTEKKPGITLAITEDNQVYFAQMDSQIPNDTKYAVSGFNRIVFQGKVLDRFYPGNTFYKVGYSTVRPRTTISTDGQYLTIVLFESPSTVTAAGEYVLQNFPGTTDVFNMDGGGSTNGCAQGIGPLVAETGRPVANVFGIFALKP